MKRQKMRITELPAACSLINPLGAPNSRISDFTLLAHSSALRQSGDIRRATVGKDGRAPRREKHIPGQ